MAFFKRLFSFSQMKKSDINNIIVLLWLLITIGLLSLIFPAVVRVYQGNWMGAFTVIGTGLFLAGASTLVGSVIGFLFGVPKRHKGDNDPSSAGKSAVEKYRPNTNLEQISDWLTKIIVGVGLIEFRKVIEFFKDLGAYCGSAFADSPSGEIIATSISVHYLLTGFIQGFLLAYLWLPKAFERATKNEMEITS